MALGRLRRDRPFPNRLRRPRTARNLTARQAKLYLSVEQSDISPPARPSCS